MITRRKPAQPTVLGQTGTLVEHIDDAGDERLADYRRLTDIAARRRIEGDEFFIAEGPVAIDRLIASSHRVRSVLVSHQKYERMADLLDPLAAPVYTVSKELLQDIVGFDLHRGAIAAADRRTQPTIDEIAERFTRVAVLEGLNDPENLGAIARSARALGIEALVLDPTCIDPYTRRTVRVSMGEILLLPSCRVAADGWPSSLHPLKRSGFGIWALTPAAGSQDIWELEVPSRLALMLGAEGPGLSPAAIDESDHRVRLPIEPDVDSLNVAAAAAVAFAVVGRQTRTS
jgi:tRNA G18 (ribose-2'-O)-methylase SpoU